jgi:hypothetical protein
MKRSSPGTPRTARQAKLKRVSFFVCVLFLIALIAYAEVIRPNQDAKSYTIRLETASKPLEKCFEKLAETTALKIYYAPDIPLETKKQDVATIDKEIATCRKELSSFESSSQKLMQLHFAGYTPVYRDAKVNQRQAVEVIGQSTDVLNQYSNMATFLKAYFGHVEVFSTYTAELANGNDFFGSDRIQQLATQAKDLRNRATQLRQLSSPPEFNGTKEATAVILNATANGFENLVVGYSRGNDFTVNSGNTQIDEAVASYDSTVINMPFEQLNKSYIPKQVVQLPSKIQNLLAGASE